MGKKILSLAIAFTLILNSFPLSATPNLNTPSEQSKAISESIFDSRSLIQSLNPKSAFRLVSDEEVPQACKDNPNNCSKEVTQEWDYDDYVRQKEAERFWQGEDKKCRAADQPGCAGPPPRIEHHFKPNTKWRVRNSRQTDPAKTTESSYSPEGNSYQERTSRSSSSWYDPNSPCGLWEQLWNGDNPQKCARENAWSGERCDRKLLGDAECDKIDGRLEEDSREWRAKEAQRQAKYNALSGAGKFGFWTSIALPLIAFTGGGALAGYLFSPAAKAAGGAALGGLGGFLVGGLLAMLGHAFPGSFHEGLGNALLAPLELTYGVFSGLASFFTLGHKNPSDLKLSSFLSQLHKSAERASEAVALASSGALGLGAAGVPVLSAGVGVVGFPVSLGLGLLAAANTLYRGGPVAWKKLIAEPYREHKELKLAQEKEFKELTSQSKGLDAQIKKLTQEIKISPLGKNLEFDMRFNSDMKLTTQPPDDKPNNWASLEDHVSWAWQLKEHRQELYEKLENYKSLINQALAEEQELRRLLKSLEDLIKDAPWLEIRQRNLIERHLGLIKYDIGRPPTPGLRLHVVRLWKDSVGNQLKELAELKTAAQKAEAKRSPQERLWQKEQYLPKEAIDEQKSSWQEFHKKFGTNPWPTLADQNLTKEDSDFFKNLDLRYLVSNGPLNESKGPILGELRTPSELQYRQNVSPRDCDWPSRSLPPVIIPARLEPRWQKYLNHIGAFGWTRSDFFGQQEFHAGIDIKAPSWGLERTDLPGDQQKGFGVPVGLRTEVKIIETRHDSSGYGIYLIAQDTKEPNTFYVLGHAGEDRKWLKKPDDYLKKEKLTDICSEPTASQTNPKCGYWARNFEGRPKSGLLVEEGNTIPAYRPLMVMGHSGNAATSGPDGTADTHLHLEKHVVPDEAYYTWVDKEGKTQRTLAFGEIRQALEAVRRGKNVVAIYGGKETAPAQAIPKLQTQIRQLLFNAECDTDSDGKMESCYARNPLE